MISHGCNWWKIFRRPFQNKTCFRNTPNFLRHGSISLEWRVRRGRFKSITEHRLLPISLLSSFSLPACQATPTLRLLLSQAVSFLWALQIWLWWQPYAMGLQEPVKKAVSAGLAAQCRRQSWQWFSLSSSHRRSLTAATTEVPGRRAVREKSVWERARCCKLASTQCSCWNIQRKKKGIFRQPPVLLPETWSQWFSGVRTTRYVLMPLRYLRSHPYDIYTQEVPSTVSVHSGERSGRIAD